jgi:hypothetical protein
MELLTSKIRFIWTCLTIKVMKLLMFSNNLLFLCLSASLRFSYYSQQPFLNIFYILLVGYEINFLTHTEYKIIYTIMFTSVCTRREDNNYKFNGSKYPPNFVYFYIHLVNEIFICYCHSQIVELFHIIEWFVGRLRIENLISILAMRHEQAS